MRMLLFFRLLFSTLVLRNERRMKIGFIYPTVNNRGGIERVLKELLWALADRHDVTVYAGKIDIPLPQRCRVRRVPFIGGLPFVTAFSFLVMGFLKRAGRGEDVKFTFGAAALNPDIICAGSCHKAWFFESLRQLRPLSRAWCLKLLNPQHYIVMAVEIWQYSCRKKAHVIACSDVTRAQILRYFRISPDRVSVVPNAVNVQEFDVGRLEESRAAGRGRLGLTKEDFVVIFVGNEFRRKGLEFAIESCARAKDRRLKLLVVGTGDPRPFKELAEKSGFGSQIIFRGSTNDVASKFATADVFLFPTKFEAFGLVITEAMAARLPVITTRFAGASTFIRDGENGFLLDRADDVDKMTSFLTTLQRDPVLRTKLGHAARLAVESYTWDVAARRIESICLNLKK